MSNHYFGSAPYDAVLPDHGVIANRHLRSSAKTRKRLYDDLSSTVHEDPLHENSVQPYANCVRIVRRPDSACYSIVEEKREFTKHMQSFNSTYSSYQTYNWLHELPIPYISFMPITIVVIRRRGRANVLVQL